MLSEGLRLGRGANFNDRLSATDINVINFFETSDAKSTDENQYSCTAFSDSGMTQTFVTVKVRGKFK